MSEGNWFIGGVILGVLIATVVVGGGASSDLSHAIERGWLKHGDGIYLISPAEILGPDMSGADQ